MPKAFNMEETMAKLLVVYASRTGQTHKIAELIAEGARIAGAEASVVDVKQISSPDALEGYDAYAFGSATYHGKMMNSMEQMLFIAEKAGLEGKRAGAFGAFGWSGEASERIYETMVNVFGMQGVGGPLRLKGPMLEGAIPMAHSYGKRLVEGL